MRAILSLAALAALGLAACEPETTVEAGPPDAPEPAAEAPALGGVDLTGDIRVLGTEPFWGVSFVGDTLTYDGVDRPAQTAPRTDPAIAGSTATWTTRTTAGNDLVVTVMETECSDGMSDRTYPLTARVEISGEVLNGCAIDAATLLTTDETGQPRAAE